jgi:hypothetical protein
MGPNDGIRDGGLCEYVLLCSPRSSASWVRGFRLRTLEKTLAHVRRRSLARGMPAQRRMSCRAIVVASRPCRIDSSFAMCRVVKMPYPGLGISDDGANQMLPTKASKQFCWNPSRRRHEKIGETTQEM